MERPFLSGPVVLVAFVSVVAWLWLVAPGAGAQAVIPEVSVASASAVEGRPVRFAVSLSRASDRDVVVEWRTVDDPAQGANRAAAGADYTAVTTARTLTVHAGSTTAWIVVSTSQDGVYEGDETFGVRLSDLEGVAILSGDRAVGTITEDDAAPAVSVKQAQVTLEGGSADEPAEMVFEVLLSSPSGLPVTVPYTLGGTATAGVDYVDPAAKQVVVAAGEASGSIVVTTLPDAVGEDHETVVVTLGPPTNGVLSANAGERSATGLIYDDDRSGHAVITVSPAEVPEGVQARLTYTLTITLGGGAAAESEVSTRVEVGGFVVGDSAHTATAGSDVVLSNVDEGVERPDVTLTIAAGETSTSRAFNAAVVDDSLDEFDEAVGFGHPTTSVGQTGVYLGQDNGYSYFYPRLVIRDDDGAEAPSVSAAAPAAAVAEGDDPAATAGMAFDVVLSQASGKPVTVHYALGGTATAGVDYDVPPLSLEIPAGQTRGRIVVPVRGDTVDEGDSETVAVILLGAVNAALSAVEGATVAEGVITDDDAPPSLSVADAASVAEGGTAMFEVSLSAVSGRDVSFVWRTAADAAGTHPAAAGDDYVPVGGRTVTIPAGTVRVELSVETVDDDTDEHAETFLVELSDPAGATLADGVAVATISADGSDPAPGVTIADAGDVTEGNDPDATTDMVFTVSLSAVSGKDVSVGYAVTSDDATAGVDYTAPAADAAVTVTAGESTATIAVAVRGDLEQEVHETLTVTLSGPVNAVLGDPHTASGRIVDDEADRGRPYVGVAITEASIVEGDDATVVVSASWASRDDIDVNFYVSYKHHSPYWDGAVYNGLPEPGAWLADERGVGLQIATLPAGETSVEFTIETRADSADLDGEIWAAMLTPGLIRTEGIRNIGNPDGSLDPYYPDWDSLPYLTSARDFDSVKVHDSDDAVSPRFSIGNLGDRHVTAGEPAMFRLRADSAAEAPVTVSYRVDAAGADGVVPEAETGDKTITVPAGARAEYITVPTVNTASGGDATVTVKLTRGDYTRRFTGAEADPESVHTVTATVHDDASTEPVATIAAAGDVTEGGTATFTVTLTPAPAADTTVLANVRAIGDFGAASSGPGFVGRKPLMNDHFADETEFLEFRPGTASVAFTVATADDNVDEPDGSIKVQLRPGSGYTVGAPHAAEAAVADDDAAGSTPQVSITAGPDVTEGHAASFTVTADPAPSVAFDVELAVTATGDHGAATGAAAVTVPTSGTATLTVATADDQVDEPDGSVAVTVQPAPGYTVSPTQSSATVAVADDDVGPVVTVTAGPAVTEGQTATFTITATPAPDSPLDVDVAVTATGDYGAATGTATVTIPAAGTATLTVDTTDDSTHEPDGAITATIQDGSDYSASNTNGAATVTVKSDDPAPVPELSITAGSAVTEGDTASFAITATPAPTSAITVNVAATQSGSFGATGAATVTVNAATTTYTITTTDDNTDEPDGTVTATLEAGSDYTVSTTAGAATTTVHDNDNPPGTPEVSIISGGIASGNKTYFLVIADPAPASPLPVVVSADLPPEVPHLAPSSTITIPTSGAILFPGPWVKDSFRGLVTAWLHPPAADAGYTVSPTQDEATFLYSNENLTAGYVKLQIDGGSPIIEGGQARFRIRAIPRPQHPVTAKVGIFESGDFGASGPATVTVSDSFTWFTVSTTDDGVREADGSVHVMLLSGSGYGVKSTFALASVSVADNDAATTPTTPATVPEVSITGGSAVTEGGTASFTITATPAPTSAITVNVAATQSGSFGATGAATVTVNAATTTYTITTTDDNTDEPDGTVTATLEPGSGYTVSTTAGAASVAVSDDDATPLPKVTLTASKREITEGESVTFTVSVDPPQYQTTYVYLYYTYSGDFDFSQSGIRYSDTQNHYDRFQFVDLLSGVRTDRITVDTFADDVEEPDGHIAYTVRTHPSYIVSGPATVKVLVHDDNTPPAPEVTPEGACTGLPTVTIDDAEAKRTDATVDFTVSLDCKPAGTVTVYVAEAVDGLMVTGVTPILLTSDNQSQTFTINVRPTGDQSLIIAYATGAKNRFAQGKVVFE